MAQQPVGISVFFPAFNDEKTIGTLLTEALKILPTLTDNYEVIVVNDGSTDTTKDVIEGMARVYPHLQVVEHLKNQGYGAALRSGFGHASKDLIFYTDGDGQYDVRELACLLPLMTANCDVVNGYKCRREDPRHRIFIGGLYNRLAHLLFQLPIRDIDCDFRVIRKTALDGIELVSSSGAICVELIYKLHAAGCVFAEGPVRHYARAHGRSQFFTFKRVTRTAYDLLGLWIDMVIRSEY